MPCKLNGVSIKTEDHHARNRGDDNVIAVQDNETQRSLQAHEGAHTDLT